MHNKNHSLNRKVGIFLLLPGLALSFTSCVSKKKFQAQLTKYEYLSDSCDKIRFMLDQCLSEKSGQVVKIHDLQMELETMKRNTNSLVSQLSELSVITKTQAESISRSLENINSKENYIRNMQNAMARKDSLNLALVLALKGALKDVNDKDIDIRIEGSAVFIAISDKLLFPSASIEPAAESKQVLGKVATVLNSRPDLQFMIEGHTDNKPVLGGTIRDNWDLSVLRATAVARVLQNEYKVDPKRITAAGRSEYLPATGNETDQGRAQNRRTRIVILPQLDQFVKLIEDGTR
jgi:chemotaxis protein MotB